MITPDKIAGTGDLDWSYFIATVSAELLSRDANAGRESPSTTGKADWPPNYDKVLAFRKQQLALFKSKPEMLTQAWNYYGGRDLLQLEETTLLDLAPRCVDFINHWCDTFDPRNAGTRGKLVRMPLILFPRQEEFVYFILACMTGDASGLVEKSRDMGATWVAGAVSVWLWLFFDGMAVGWGSNLLEKVDKLNDPQSVHEKVRMLIKWLPSVLQPSGFDPDKHLLHKKTINPENGSIITADGGTDIGRGGRTRVYFVDEGAHLEHPELAEAALSENTRSRIDISSVSPPGTVFHRTREAGLDWRFGQGVVRDRANVFVMGWEDHPAKDAEWYNNRKAYFESKGLPSVFAREVERNYMGAQEGTMIKVEWVKASRNAHLHPLLKDLDWFGENVGGLDVADGGLDRNAIALRDGRVLNKTKQWGERDTGVTARRAVKMCADVKEPFNLQYDSIGVGAGVKAEANRLKDDDLWPDKLTLTPWNAGGAVLYPNEHLLKLENGRPDKESPKNYKFFRNIKAQGWWKLARAFENIYKLVTALKEITDPEEQQLFIDLFDIDELISIDVKSVGEDDYRLLEKELCQAVGILDTKLRLVIDKSPEGTASPNMADAVMMAYWPQRNIPVNGPMFGPKLIRG